MIDKFLSYASSLEGQVVLTVISVGILAVILSGFGLVDLYHRIKHPMGRFPSPRDEGDPSGPFKPLRLPGLGWRPWIVAGVIGLCIAAYRVFMHGGLDLPLEAATQ